jgi:hypothetical protein
VIGEPRGGESEKEKRRRRLLLLLLLLLLIPAALGGGLVANLLRAPAVCSLSTPSAASPAPSPSAIETVGGVVATPVPTPTPTPTPTPMPSPVGSGDGGAQVGDATFRITGDVGNLQPGLALPIQLTLTNPNGVPIYVTSLSVSISADSTPPGCTSASNVHITQSNVSGADPIVVPARGSVTLTSAPRAPQIMLLNLPGVNQNVCKNKNFGLSYSGSARL